MDARDLHLLLIGFMFVMYFVALAYLSRQRLPFHAFVLWSLSALFLPVLGPFLVIALRPGQPR